MSEPKLKKSFVLYADQREMIEDLSYEEKGKLLDALFEYAESGHIPLIEEKPVLVAFKMFKVRINHDNDKYLDTCRKRKEAIEKRWEKQKNTNEYNCIVCNTKDTDKDKDKDKDKELHESKDSMSNNITFLTEGMSHSDADATKPKTFREKIVASFNACVRGKNIKPIRSINDGTQRAESLKARRRQYGDDAIEEMFMKAANSSFLNGFNKKGWTATFDWLIRPNNFPKVLEGNYDDEKINETTIQQTDWQA